MRTAGAVSRAGGIYQSAAKGFCRDQSLEAEPLRGDHALRTPSRTSIERAVERDRAVAKVVPGDIDLALRTNEGNCADPSARSAGIIRTGNAERCPVIGGCGNPSPPAGRAAGSGIPCQIEIVAERAERVGIGRDHGLVVEMILARLEAEEVYGGPGLAAVGGARNCHLRSVNVARAEEHHDVAIKHVAPGVVSQAWVGAKIDSIIDYRGWQRQVHAAPTASVVRRKIATHGQAENLIGTCRQSRGMVGIECDIRFALWPAFIGDVYVGADAQGRGCSRAAVGPAVE